MRRMRPMCASFRQRHPRLDRIDRVIGTVLFALIAGAGAARVARALGVSEPVEIVVYLVTATASVFGAIGLLDDPRSPRQRSSGSRTSR